MNTALPRSYKTLMALVLVGGPLVWLLLTTDGQRRTDLVLLPLFGRPVVDFSFTDMNSGLREEDIRARLPDVELQCFDAPTPFGDRVCNARIGAFGRLPAEALSFFFSALDLRAAKLAYRQDVHEELVASVVRQLGEGDTNQPKDQSGESQVVTWPVADGILLVNAGDLAPREEAALLWLSGVAVAERIEASQAGVRGATD